MTWNRDRFWAQWIGQRGFLYCELASYKQGCSAGFEAHHIVSKQMLRGNKKALRFVEKHSHIFLSCLCPTHHALANNWQARYILLDARVLRFGAEPVAVAITKLLDLMKSDIPELRRYLEVT